VRELRYRRTGPAHSQGIGTGSRAVLREEYQNRRKAKSKVGLGERKKSHPKKRTKEKLRAGERSDRNCFEHAGD